MWYYDPPSDEIFEEIKEKSIEIWNTYDNTYWYVDEKINKIKDIWNISDNAMFIFWMFDINNQTILFSKISPETMFFIINNINI